jgi:hypothetical protein
MRSGAIPAAAGGGENGGTSDKHNIQNWDEMIRIIQKGRNGKRRRWFVRWGWSLGFTFVTEAHI